METELDENPIDVPPSTAPQRPPKAKVNVTKWDPENIDENVLTNKKPKKVLDLFKSPWDVLRNDWRALLAEFVATMMFVFMGTGLLVSYNKDKTQGGDLGAGLVSNFPWIWYSPIHYDLYGG